MESLVIFLLGNHYLVCRWKNFENRSKGQRPCVALIILALPSRESQRESDRSASYVERHTAVRLAVWHRPTTTDRRLRLLTILKPCRDQNNSQTSLNLSILLPVTV